LALLFFVPYAGVMPGMEQLPEMIENESVITPLKVQDNTFTMVLTIIPIVIALVTIFLFGNRPLQMKFCLANLVLIGALLIALLGYIYQYEQDFFNRHLENFDIGLLLPVIALVLTYLAYRGVRRDEELVRSADRFW
jgi:peptidoglycan/LPS O-acetylase OafA/YrhL